MAATQKTLCQRGSGTIIETQVAVTDEEEAGLGQTEITYWDKPMVFDPDPQILPKYQQDPKKSWEKNISTFMAIQTMVTQIPTS